jgi:hypothetical protein
VRGPAEIAAHTCNLAPWDMLPSEVSKSVAAGAFCCLPESVSDGRS